MANYQSKYTGAQIDAGITAAQAALPKSGGTMTGALTLAADPTADMQAATKKYVDASKVENVVQYVAQTLTDEQKAQARTNIGAAVSGEFELIEEFVLTEAVMNISRSLYPDGTPYNLKSLIIKIKTEDNAVTANAEGWVRLNNLKSSDNWSYVATGNIVDVTRRVAYFIFRRLSDGSVNSYYEQCAADTITGYNGVGARTVVPINLTRFNYLINDFYLYSTTNSIPAGTKITIYGVKA